MKRYNINLLFILFGAIVLLYCTSCKKYLEEENPSGKTDQTYYNTAQGYEDLVKTNYSSLRSTVRDYTRLYTLGTDIYSSYGTSDANELNLYSSSLNPDLGDVMNYWAQLYYSINLTNTAIYWANEVTGMSATTLGYRIGEAKTIRAFDYFLLAETFGGVPLKLTRSTEAAFNLPRATEQEVYTQIITDLTDAVNVLPATTSDWGRVTKSCAQHLLAKVYLTRAYKSYGDKTNDLTQAATLAEAVISSGNYSLVSKWSDLFDPTISGFQKNSEVIFSIQYSSLTNDNTNNLYQNFLWDTQSITPIGRSSLYNKPSYTSVPTPFFFGLFDKTMDARYLGTVWNALICQTAGSYNGVSFAVGDTVIYYPDVAWTAAQKATVKYTVINPDEYRNKLGTLERSFPEFKKFRETGLTFSDALGTRDTYVFRLAETYLIAAEAYLQLNSVSKALQYYNVVRARAAKSGYSTLMQVATLTLDDVLDERARELAGEEFRWFELKRTGKLISRTLLHNEECAAKNATIDAHFLLRPIPGLERTLTGNSIDQNAGY